MKTNISSKYGLLYRVQGIFWLVIVFHFEMFVNLLHNLGFSGWRKKARLPESLEGKTVLITGANAGLGKACTRSCLQLGAKVVLACRNQTKALAAIEEILAQVGQNKRDQLLLVQLDLASLDSVRACAKQINDTVQSIDVLINNAGTVISPENKSKDGLEYRFACNHLGHFLWTNLLMDKLKASGSARIVNVSSFTHLAGNLHVNMDDSRPFGFYTSFLLYSRSKLANILFTLELSQRLKACKSDLTVYAAHPGVVDTGISQSMPNFWMNFLTSIQGLTSLSPEMGAQTILHCAFSEDTQNQSGFYYANCSRVQKMWKHAIDHEEAAKLWNLSKELIDIQRKQKSTT